MISTQNEKRGRYDFAAIERKWQDYWERSGTFVTPNPGQEGFDASKPKCFVLDMFPYPSGAGLHVGHPLGYCATDIYARYKRMCGYNVLHPMGYDAFGLPAEQYAIETGVHPAVTTKTNIENMRRQLKMFGFSYDWTREFATCDSSFYKFTQWIFVQLFQSWYDPRANRARPISELVIELESETVAITDSLTIACDDAPGDRRWSDLNEAERRTVVDGQRLAYIDEVTVNWCPALGTVLSNEEVTNDGRSDRGDHPVFRRPLRQWMLRITRYAERLLAGLDDVDWPEPIKLMQRNWIGRSTGAEVDFPIASGGPNAPTINDFATWRRDRRGRFSAMPADNVIRIYTTRPDTLFGATYMVLAPEHPLVERITTDDRRDEVMGYVESARHRSDLDRTADAKEKTGVFTGGYAINPVNGERIPVWVADYVLMGYGTGAIMAVPGGDARDFQFAKKFNLDIIAVVEPPLEWAECDARMPKGTLKELRGAAATVLRESAERWKADGDSKRTRQISFIEEYLKKHRDDTGLTPETVRDLYLGEPSVFDAPFCGEGVARKSPAGTTELGDEVCSLNDLPTAQAKRTIIDWLEQQGTGRGAVNFKIRDWIFSRQKYWGEPFPVLHHDNGSVITLDETELPLTLPEMENFKPEKADDDAETLPRPPLARAADWMTVERDGRRYTRDSNTMPQWAGSCWYYLRFADALNKTRFASEEAERYWMPVDLYVGGAEHAVLHLLYARFWHKALFDLGHVSTDEPFRKLVNQGMVQAFAYRDAAGRMLSPDRVEPREGDFVDKESGATVSQVVAKMSKSLKNVVNPDEIIHEYGADTFRLYEMYMGPIESSKPWNTRDVPGLLKLVQRIWRLVVDQETGELSVSLVNREPNADLSRLLHKSIKRITEDIEQLKFNTAIAQMFEFVNAVTPMTERPRAVIETFILLVSPFVPHLGEELWQRLGHVSSVAFEPWPQYDPALAADDEVEIAVQITGKIKSRIVVPADADDDRLRETALADPKVAAELQGKTVRRVIVVKGRLVNIIAT